MFEQASSITLCVEEALTLNLNVLDLVFLVFVIFELGFLVGRQWQLKWIVRILMTNRFVSLPAPSEAENKKSSLISQDSTASECLSMVADKQHLDPDNVETLFFQEKLPFQATKRNTTSNFQLILEKRGSSLFKVEKYEQVSEFQGSSSLATYQFNKLKQTMKRMSDTDIQADKNGIQLKLARTGTHNKTDILFKRMSFRETENKIQIDQLCENRKLKTLFENVKKIGEGGFGSVYEATHKVEKKQYAIKKIFLKDLKKKDLLKEVTIVNHLSHANIVRYYTWWIEEVVGAERKEVQFQYDIPSPQLKIKRAISFSSIPISSNEGTQSIVFQDVSRKRQVQPIAPQKAYPKPPAPRESNKVYSLQIQMQLYKDGTLSEYLKNRSRKINPAVSFSIIKQLFNGLEFLHSHGVIHRDLKPANVFLDHKQNLIKIGDFGLSVFVDKEISIGEYLLSNKLGTPCYMAPEIKETSRIPQPELLDVYSLGVIYYELLKKFNSEHERVTKLKDIQYGKIDLEDFPVEKELIRMMTRSHKTRLQVSKIRETAQFKQLQSKYQGATWIDRSLS